MLATTITVANHSAWELSARVAGLVDVDATALVQFAFFIALVLVLPKLIFEPLLARFDLRESRTEGARQEAKAMLKEAQAKESAYESATAKEKQRALAERAAARADAQKKAAALIASVRAETNDRIDAGIVAMRGEAAKAKESLDAEAAELADLIANKLMEGQRS
ncbi:MAG TPA: H(+)-transporting ATPase [Myxococcales bacterium]|nr:H(+)-transporting ATPase [Myxococcales bacterium]HAN31372.1 H(+)-transporting ATPase [Myxococcales bacterium]